MELTNEKFFVLNEEKFNEQSEEIREAINIDIDYMSKTAEQNLEDFFSEDVPYVTYSHC